MHISHARDEQDAYYNIAIKGECCSFCDCKTPSAMWGWDTDVFVCRTCAVEVLPALLADAVCHPGADTRTLREIWDRAEARFWRAVCIQRAK